MRQKNAIFPKEIKTVYTQYTIQSVTMKYLDLRHRLLAGIWRVPEITYNDNP